MKRYLCTVATGLLLAMVGTGTATAAELPVLGQSGTQIASFGDQTVGEQRNDSEVTQAQGNGNVNIAPAVAVFGDAETTNEQGNDNQATADVDQSNSVEQTQSSSQKQSLEQSGGACCAGQSQTGEQSVDGGDQTVGKQSNDADVDQYQGNGNVNVSPAIAVFGNAETTNHQGNGNDADATVEQSNSAEQTQSSSQNQSLEQEAPSCCKGSYGCKDRTGHPCKPRPRYEKPKEDCCDRGSSQTGEQRTSFGGQTVEKQSNEAAVTQKQGNGNVNVAPAIDVGGKKHESCRSKCGGGTWKPSYGDAETRNVQGSGNEANASLDQSNSVEQTQTSYQRQSLVEMCKGLVQR
jgi:hypothetical protein